MPEIFLGAFLAVAVFAMGMLFASSFQSSNYKQAATTEQHASDKKTENHESAQSLWVPTDSVGLYTSVLAVFTALLTFVSACQGYFLLRADRTARIAANAADLSARAAVALELPIIRVEPGKFGWGKSIEDDQTETEYFSLQWFDLANLGRTNAYPIEICWGWFVGDELPDTPIYVFRKPFDIGTILKPEVPGEIQVHSEMLIAPGDTWKIVRHNTKLWLFCSLAYDDFMQTRHDVGFCWLRYETFGKGGFRLDATAPAYNRKT
jgi:hypothetical protein